MWKQMMGVIGWLLKTSNITGKKSTNAGAYIDIS